MSQEVVLTSPKRLVLLGLVFSASGLSKADEVCVTMEMTAGGQDWVRKALESKELL